MSTVVPGIVVLSMDKNSFGNKVHRGDWTTELAIIASNAKGGCMSNVISFLIKIGSNVIIFLKK